jgi:acetylornithine deacetylase
VIFGPGSTAIMHANDEYVSIEDYITSIKVMALSIYDWCNGEPLSAANKLDRPHRTKA